MVIFHTKLKLYGTSKYILVPADLIKNKIVKEDVIYEVKLKEVKQKEVLTNGI